MVIALCHCHNHFTFTDVRTICHCQKQSHIVKLFLMLSQEAMILVISKVAYFKVGDHLSKPNDGKLKSNEKRNIVYIWIY